MGIYSLLFAEYAKTTYAFEPLPRNLSFLYRMLESNKVNNVVIVPCAVADVDGLTWFEAAESNAEGKVTENGTLPVPVVTLDTFIKKSKICPSLLKIDVEGSELSVLEGAKAFLAKSKPIILLETHGDELKNECFAFLRQMEYRHFEPIDAESVEEANDFVIKS